MNRMDIENFKAEQDGKIGGQKKKDQASLDHLRNEWRRNCYWLDGTGLYCPADNIEAALIGAGKKMKLGMGTFKEIVSRNLVVSEPQVPIKCSKNFKSLDEIMKAGWVFEKIVKQGRIPAVRRRVMIPTPWEITFTLIVDDPKEMSRKNLQELMEIAGGKGLMDWRPKFGTFEAEILEWRD